MQTVYGSLLKLLSKLVKKEVIAGVADFDPITDETKSASSQTKDQKPVLNPRLITFDADGKATNGQVEVENAKYKAVVLPWIAHG